MARLNQGPNGPFSGKAGSVIGSSWKKIYYIKGLQRKSSKPRSHLQIEQQEKFKLAVGHLSKIKDTLKESFGHINPGGATGYNMALSYMINNHISGRYPDLVVDVPALQISRGKINLPEHAEMEQDGLKLTIRWSTETDPPYSTTTDNIHIMYFSKEDKHFQYGIDVQVNRSKGEREVEFTEKERGKSYHVYLLVSQTKSGKWSNTMHLGEITF